MDASSETVVGVCGRCSWRTMGDSKVEVLRAGHRHACAIHSPRDAAAVYAQIHSARHPRSRARRG